MAGDFDPRSITRPEPVLLTYYLWVSLLTVLGFPFVFLAHYCKYATLRYRFDDEGISMSWGVLFKREVVLAYRRIQDIHVTRNLFQRWLGLASVSIQTASGSGSAEMTIEGITRADELRDFLYRQMRGVKDDLPGEQTPDAGDGALALLTDIRDRLQRLLERVDALERAR